MSSGPGAAPRRRHCGSVRHRYRNCRPCAGESWESGPLLKPAWGVMTGDGAAVCREAVAESCRALSENRKMTLPLYYYVLGTPLGVLGLVRWSFWLVRRIPAVLYRPVPDGARLPISVVVPVYQEDPVVLAAAIESWLDNHVSEVILVIDESDRVCQEVASRYAVTVIITDVPGKRDALRRGWNHARTELVALVDSDTIWAPDVAVEVSKPFADPQIGGVGTRQSVYGTDGLPGPDHRHVPRPPLLRRERQPELPRAGGVLPVRADRGLPAAAAAGRRARLHERDVLGRAVAVRRRQAADHADPGARLPDLHAAHRPGLVDVPDHLAGVLPAAAALGAQHLALGPAGAVEPVGLPATRSWPSRWWTRRSAASRCCSARPS